MLVKIKKWYISLLEKREKRGGELLFYYILLLLSFIYGFIAALRNFFYDTGILKSFTPLDSKHLTGFTPSKKVISIGNISWSGAGKTTLTIWLYKRLADKFKTAILRRGYGDDEGRLLNQTTSNVYAGANRAVLARKLASDFSLFILDDGFQHRKLNRNVNIVVMAAREFRSNFRLIPANIFREPLSALNRAQIVVINYADELDKPEKTREFLLSKFGHLKIFFTRYKFRRFIGINNQEHSPADLKTKQFAALTATGYPQGFFNALKDLNLSIAREITYPDHYKLTEVEFTALAEELHKEQIIDIIVTAKDRYHLPQKTSGLNIYILEVEMEIEREDEFLREVEKNL